MPNTCLPALFRDTMVDAEAPGTSPFLAVLGNIEELTPEIVQGLISLATLHPFDPNAKVNGCPLLSVIIQKSKPRKAEHQVVGRKLPRSPGEPGAIGTTRDGSRATVDGEWLAGLVMMAGGDPWEESPITGTYEKAGMNAMERAMTRGMTSFVAACLALPGAPGAHELAKSVAKNRSPRLKDESSWWEYLCHEGHTGILETMVASGVDPGATTADGKHPLEMASQRTMATYDEKGWTPGDQATRERILKTWIARSRDGELRFDDLEQMMARLHAADGSAPGCSRILVEALLATPWKSASTTKARGVSHELECSQALIEHGYARGRWSGITAAAAAVIRSGRPWLERNIVLSEGASDASCKDAAVNQENLRQAISFDWRPGIPAAGIVALALVHGMPKSDDESWQGAASIFRTLGLKTAGAARAWMKELIPAAVQFTKTLRGTGGASSSEVLAERWKCVEKIVGPPSAWGGDGWKLAHELTMALRVDQNPSWHLTNWMTGLARQPPPDGTADPEGCLAHARICLEVAWSSRNGGSQERQGEAAGLLGQHPAQAIPHLRAHLAKDARTMLESAPPNVAPIVMASIMDTAMAAAERPGRRQAPRL